jgi:thiol-disulfide isomerase/thioredoxin
MISRPLPIALLALLLAAPGALAQSAAGFRARIDAYESAVRANTLRIIEARSEEERARFRASVPDSRPCAAEVLALIHAHPSAPDLAEGLNWLLTQCIHLPEGAAALDLVAQKYAALPGIAPGLKRLEDVEPALAAPALQAVLHSSAPPDEKAAALFALGGHHFRAFESAPDESSRAAARDRASALLQQVVTDYPAVKIQGFPLADQASALLFEITNLSVGALAPEITGPDHQNQPLKLGDFRGRAVLLVFWGDWCHGCHGLQPVLAELASTFKDRPLTLLGVNTDDPATARKVLAASPVPWRCWLDGSTSGPVTSAWNLRHFPTLYLLGKDGRILAKDPSLADLRPLIEKALAAP